MTYDALGPWAVSIGWLRRHALATAVLATAIVSLILVAAPGLDRSVSSAFFTPPKQFGGTPGSLVNTVRWLGIYVNWLAVAAFVGAYAAKLLPNVQWQGISWANLKFLTAAALLGPGLIVNGILKSFWGRARPIQTDWFGGTWPYSPPWLPVDHCVRNCSFVSGEASASFCFIALAFVAPPAWRRTVVIAALVFAIAIGWARIAAGGHYLSDVVIAWGLTLIAILIARRLFPVPLSER
jgi:lipid A 4'-phosphatase